MCECVLCVCARDIDEANYHECIARMGDGTCVGVGNMVYAAAVMVHHPASGDEDRESSYNAPQVDPFPLLKRGSTL